ncbi:MAG: hypothetical protein V7K25_00025 [Nostoc sp.]
MFFWVIGFEPLSPLQAVGFRLELELTFCSFTYADAIASADKFM